VKDVDRLKSDCVVKGLIETLKNEIVTTICAFMNSAGGILLVGVQDDGSVYGLEEDFRLSGKGGNWDSWLQTLASLVHDKIGTEFIKYVKVELIEYIDKIVAKIIVEKNHCPAYVEIKDAEF
jgi:predicted HTH transcriptional regulator